MSQHRGAMAERGATTAAAAVAMMLWLALLAPGCLRTCCPSDGIDRSE